MKDASAILFNDDWKFLFGNPKNAYHAGFHDRTWKRVDLPHDWVISRPFKRGDTGSYNAQNMQGFFAWEGIVWYRKEFTLPDLSGKEVYIYFGGAYRNSTVYVNGQEAGGRAYGYSSFELDITALVQTGRNIIAVRLDNGCEAPDRWYAGSGLFRNVYLRIVPAAHIKTWGVHVTAEMTHNKKAGAKVTIDTAIVNKHGCGSGLVRIQVLGPDGGLSAESSAPFDLAGKNEVTARQQLVIQNPALWSAEEPNLYRVVVHLETNGEEGKPVEVPFGFRTIDIVYKKGMSVNGRPVKLKGVCLHHDCGITGSAYYDAAWRRRLLALKSIGCNAIRTSHNPPAEEFLDLCDELGFYVIDECFDKWKSGYYAAHFDRDSRRDLEEFILRDRNHPSVFMWSIGNEVENQAAPSMLEIQKQLAGIVRALDGRPITCALEPHVHPRTLVGAPPAELVKLTKKLARDVDVLGFNYQEALYEDYTAGIERPIVGTECYEYYTGTAVNYEDIISKNPWRYVLENDNVIGQFIWSGIDYLGECGWPSKGWTGAILDICGFLKPNAWFRKSIWTTEPMIYIALYDQSVKPNYARGRWSFPGTAAQLNLDHLRRRTVTAAVYTNCDEAELWINGKKWGRRKPADFENGIIEWTFEYTEGEVKVTGYRKGKAACSHILKTAGAAKRILLTQDKTALSAGSGGIAHIEVTVTDENGVPCPNEEQLIEFALTGGGEILGACSPDLNAGMGFTLPKVITSGGKALVMVKAGANSGTLELAAYSEQLEPASVKFTMR